MGHASTANKLEPLHCYHYVSCIGVLVPKTINIYLYYRLDSQVLNYRVRILLFAHSHHRQLYTRSYSEVRRLRSEGPVQVGRNPLSNGSVWDVWQHENHHCTIVGYVSRLFSLNTSIAALAKNSPEYELRSEYQRDSSFANIWLIDYREQGYLILAGFEGAESTHDTLV